MTVVGLSRKIILTLMILAIKHLPDFVQGLYPRDSPTREVKCLDGIWRFRLSESYDPEQGIEEEWFNDDLSNKGPTIQMPVPSSYNDITTNSSLRDHVGGVWYDRKFYVPLSWADKSVWIRFSSVHYRALVWINGNEAVQHEIGHLPFEAEITNFCNFGEENRVTVLVNNILTQTTIPQGSLVSVTTDSGSRIDQRYTFDFFNYAGIHRSVHLYCTPRTRIVDVILTTDFNGDTGILRYVVTTSTNDNPVVLVQIYNADDNIVAVNTEPANEQSTLEVPNVQLWWPYLMHTQPGYLYKMEVFLSTESTRNIDVYHLKFGFRSIRWDATSFLINEKPIYFRGFGRHEDSDIRGKGLDLALLTKDYDLLRWIGANCYRTSHYPYSEEAMDFADEAGIMIIDECSSVNTENYSENLLEQHKNAIEELFVRDRNHPCIVMWSIANEARTSANGANSYFQRLADFTRTLDPTRPITMSIAVSPSRDQTGQHLDIISVNRYRGWYESPGQLDTITNGIVNEMIEWNSKYGKPVIMSEYGADTIEGLHIIPEFVWSEEYQVALFSRYFEAFDILRSQHDFFIGEFVWNFADFKTEQMVTRVGGNKKGVFTRNRQPKAAAHHLRRRYFELGKKMDNATLPDDLYPYITDTTFFCQA
uniref:Beta-glucuronidase n=1 Tax=Phlebotomus papatasi TaxID=29031 RepID=A0A1B0EXE1_PHLPP